jgi:large subunit ribosomal protein L13e
MVKHNNAVPNGHFHKDWQRHVRTWFNQPARKVARRAARLEKATRLAPRPIESLRPIVRGQTVKYNAKVKAGRGFTLEELKAAGVNANEARGIGICVDHRRKNRSQEGFQLNVNRLKLYKSKLVVFPRRPTSKRLRKGDSSKADQKAVSAQVSLSSVLPATVPTVRSKARVIKQAEFEVSQYSIARKARTDAKLLGVREKRAKDKAAAAAGKKKPAEDGMDE